MRWGRRESGAVREEGNGAWGEEEGKGEEETRCGGGRRERGAETRAARRTGRAEAGDRSTDMGINKERRFMGKTGE